MKLEIIKDQKKDIEFWLNALDNENLNRDNQILLNECLKQCLMQHLNPFISVKTNV